MILRRTEMEILERNGGHEIPSLMISMVAPGETNRAKRWTGRKREANELDENR